MYKLNVILVLMVHAYTCIHVHHTNTKLSSKKKSLTVQSTHASIMYMYMYMLLQGLVVHVHVYLCRYHSKLISMDIWLSISVRLWGGGVEVNRTNCLATEVLQANYQVHVCTSINIRQTFGGGGRPTTRGDHGCGQQNSCMTFGRLMCS